MAQGDLFETRVISDFLLDKDPIFAQLTLVDDELNLYRQIYQQLSVQTPTPDLVIYLQAEPQVLLDRIKKRGIAMEAGISDLYLARLCLRTDIRELATTNPGMSRPTEKTTRAAGSARGYCTEYRHSASLCVKLIVASINFAKR